jgi:hypothetical protein
MGKIIIRNFLPFDNQPGEICNDQEQKSSTASEIGGGSQVLSPESGASARPPV